MRPTLRETPLMSTSARPESPNVPSCCCLDRTTLRDVACPLAEVARATPDEPVADVLPRLNGCSDGRALVLDGQRLAGIVAPADISRAPERISGNRECRQVFWPH